MYYDNEYLIDWKHENSEVKKKDKKYILKTGFFMNL